MKNSILALTVLATLAFATSCNKSKQDSVTANPSKSTGMYNPMSGLVSANEIHDALVSIYISKYGIEGQEVTKESCDLVHSRMVPIADSFLGTTLDWSFYPRYMDALDSLGVFDENGIMRDVQTVNLIKASIEPNTALRTAYVNIANSTLTGSSLLSYANSQLNSLSGLNSDEITRRNGFRDILGSSTYIPYGAKDAASQKRIADADSEAYTVSYLMLLWGTMGNTIVAHQLACAQAAESSIEAAQKEKKP